MRVSVIPETQHGVCEGCHLPGAVTTFTITVGTGTESSPPLCAGCLRAKGEVTVDVDQPVPDTRPGPPDHRVKRTSRRNEQDIAVRIGGRRQPGSGAIPGFKGDVRVRGHLRVELKDSFSKQFILTTAVLDKIRGECDRAERPALIVSFRDRHTHELRESWALIPVEHWEELLNASNDR